MWATYSVAADEPPSSDWGYWRERTMRVTKDPQGAPTKGDERWRYYETARQKHKARLDNSVLTTLGTPLDDLLRQHAEDDLLKRTARALPLADSSVLDAGLRVQCSALDLELIESNQPVSTKAEAAGLDFLASDHTWATNDEGGTVKAVVDSLARGVSMRTKGRKPKAPLPSPAEMLYSAYSKMGFWGQSPESRLVVASSVLEAVQEGTREDLERGWEKLRKERPAMYGPYGGNAKSRPPISPEELTMVYSVIGRETLLNLCSLVLLAPHYFFNGWPDLCAIKNGKLVLYEVKGSDCLHASQIRTIPALRRLGIEVAVLRVGARRRSR